MIRKRTAYERAIALFKRLNEPRRQLRTKAVKAAEAASLEAHAEWHTAKASADPMRRRRERVALSKGAA